MKMSALTVELRTILDGKKVDIEEVKRAVGHSAPCLYCTDKQQMTWNLAPVHGGQWTVKFCERCGRKLQEGL